MQYVDMNHPFDSKFRTQLNSHTKAILQSSEDDGVVEIGKLQSSAVELASIASMFFIQRVLDQTISDHPIPESTSSSSSDDHHRLTVKNLQETIHNHPEQFSILQNVVTEDLILADSLDPHNNNNKKRPSSILTEGLVLKKPQKNQKQQSSSIPSSKRTRKKYASSSSSKQPHTTNQSTGNIKQALRIFADSLPKEVKQDLPKVTQQHVVSKTERKILVDEEDYDEE